MLARFPRRPRVITLIGAVALVFAIANPAAAPPGDLDTTFDGDGRVTTDFGSHEQAFAVAIQGDGKLVAAGEALVSGILDFALARYNTDGSLDPTFDGDGKVTTDFAGGADGASAVAIQGDGKLVAAGFAIVSGNYNFALARYNTDGSLDTTFGGDLPFPVPGDGKVTTDFAGSEDLAHGVALQGDGRIVAAGEARVSGILDFAMARYNADGSLDPTFDGDGKVTTDFASSSDLAYGVAIQGDGKIVAAGQARVSGSDDFALARYNADGSLDLTFDGDGKVTTDFAGNFDVADDVALQGDGKIVTAGGAAVPGFDFALARYNADGSLDPTFDGDGKVTTDFGGFDDASAVTLQGNGRIVAAGTTDTPSTNFALARYNTNGALDTTFSGDGKVTTDFAGGGNAASAVAIQANGRIVAAGFAFDSSFDFALARYTCLRRTSRPTSIPVCP